jgi:hypothetical protein
MQLDGARIRSQNLMVDACGITRTPDRYVAGTVDPGTLAITDTSDQVYSGKCYIAPQGLQPQTSSVGGNDASVKRYIVAIPFSAPKLRPGDRVTVTESQDPELVGEAFEIQDVGMGSALIWRQATMLGLETSRG